MWFIFCCHVICFLLSCDSFSAVMWFIFCCHLIHFLLSCDSFSAVMWFVFCCHVIHFLLSCDLFCAVMWFIFCCHVIHFLLSCDSFSAVMWLFSAVMWFIFCCHVICFLLSCDLFSAVMWLVFCSHVIHFLLSCDSFPALMWFIFRQRGGRTAQKSGWTGGDNIIFQRPNQRYFYRRWRHILCRQDNTFRPDWASCSNRSIRLSFNACRAGREWTLPAFASSALRNAVLLFASSPMSTSAECSTDCITAFKTSLPTIHVYESTSVKATVKF